MHQHRNKIVKKTLVLASGNKGKVAELTQLLSPLSVHVVPQSDYQVTEVPETGTTFIENAIIKARHASKVTGLPAIADDSGLAVEALNGAPGIYSARYASEGASDQQNYELLLKNLAQVPASQRNAQFHCCLVYMPSADHPVPTVCHGIWHGTIATSPSGATGFGYDPVFYVPEFSCTAADMGAQKQTVSHRYLALQSLLKQLKGTL